MDNETANPAPNYFHGNYKDERLPYPDGIKDLSSITKLLRIGLILFIPLAALLAVLTAYIMTDTQGYISTLRRLSLEGSMLVPGIAVFSLIYRLTYIFCIVLTCWLLFRATRNLQTIAPGEMTLTPHWAWLWFFIPFANFYKPYKAVVEIDRETRRLAGIAQREDSRLISWWTCFILSVFIGATDVRLPIANLDLTLRALDVVSGVLAIIAAVMFIQITRDLASHQALLKAEGITTVFD